MTAVVKRRKHLNVSPNELLGVKELADRADVAKITIHKWRERHADFPEPFVELSTGPIWYWPDVKQWLKKPRPPGRPNGKTR